ncbi:glycosyltransferase family 4 protein [Kiloniella sp. b19]|uniref:glycosyltransferase family 4 protein n=1 Tax=Kiloniella sp. GXU_MW_B19 TaxID=3141326 RepID=UPI0031D6787A
MSQTISVVLKGYPRLSETFIAQELLALERQGFDLRLVSLRHPTDKSTHPIHQEIRAPVSYLPEYLYQEPLRVLKSWWKARRLPGYSKALKTFFKDLRRDITPNRVRRFGQACVMAAELPSGVDWIYSHFLHTPSSVARYCSLMTGHRWSASAHAKDIWTSPEWELREKLDDIQWLATCTSFNVHHLRGLAAEPDKVDLVYHGLDFNRFDREQAAVVADGAEQPDKGPVVILSVGRAVPKKGYDLILKALAQLPAELDWRFVHIGGGSLSKSLMAQAEELGLQDRIDWMGAQSQQTVLAQYRSSDIFVLASRITEDGDRDGLPNVLMEAQSQGLACLATEISAIPELLVEGETGLMVPPEDPERLAGALERLVRSRELRNRLGSAGQKRVRAEFTMDRGIARLVERFNG